MCWIVVMLVFITKLAVLWAAASVTALHLPCEEYCTCLSSGIRDVEYQPECHCMFQEVAIDHSGIYYEPADRSAPAFVYNHPFYIINPILELRHKQIINNARQAVNIAPKTRQVPKTIGLSAEMDIDTENTHSSHRRKEKDIQADIERSNNPLYLDIDLESDDSERSASTNSFTAENLKLTERSLIECAELYNLLNYRKDNNIKHLNSREQNLLHKYEHLSNRDLIKVINNKCLQISYIVDKSLKEIKEKRPKKVNNSFSNSGHQENRETPTNKDTMTTAIHNVDMITEANSQTHIIENRERGAEKYNQNTDETVIYTKTKPEENMNTLNTLPSQVVSTTDASTTNQGNDNSPDISARINDDLMSSDRTTEKYSTNTDKEYPSDKESTSISTVELLTLSTTETNEEPDVLENQRSNDDIIRNSETGETNNSRQMYEEEDVALAKVITQEFSNDTVKSYINGTEDIPNEDFKDSNTDKPNSNELPKTNTDGNGIPNETGIHGNLYFLVNQHQIPAKFVQNPNGTLHVGIDAASICNRMRKNITHTSKLLSTLCECYESDNCASKK